MVEVKIPLRAFVTKTFHFDNGIESDQVLISPPTYNKDRVAEGYDKLLTGKLELDDQDLIFYQDVEDGPIYLRELKVIVKSFNLIFVDLQFKAHEDKKMQVALIMALNQKHKTSEH